MSPGIVPSVLSFGMATSMHFDWDLVVDMLLRIRLFVKRIEF